MLSVLVASSSASTLTRSFCTWDNSIWVAEKLTPCSIPETFDVVSKTVDVQSRKNLARISEVLTQIASGAPFDDDSPNYVPLNEYVNRAIGQLSAWFLEGTRRLRLHNFRWLTSSFLFSGRRPGSRNAIPRP